MEANSVAYYRQASEKLFLSEEESAAASLTQLKALPMGQAEACGASEARHHCAKMTFLAREITTSEKHVPAHFLKFSHCIDLFENFNNGCDIDEKNHLKHVIQHLHDNAILYQFKLESAIKENHTMLKIVVPTPPFAESDHWVFLYDFIIGDINFLKKPLGKGQYKTIYKSFSLTHQKSHALSEQPVKTESQQEAVERELMTLKLLKGKAHVLQLLHYGSSKSPVQTYMTIHHMITELCDLGDLSQPRQLSHAEKLQIGLHSIKGVEALHEIEFVHRDLKPANIFLKSVEGRICAVVADFGFACHINSSTLNQLKGSPLYLPPEVLKLAKHNYQSDAWSLGVVLTVLFKGQMPFPTNVSSIPVLTEMLTRFIEQQKSHQPTENSIIEHVIWSLLRPESERMTLKKALQRLESA